MFPGKTKKVNGTRKGELEDSSTSEGYVNVNKTVEAFAPPVRSHSPSQSAIFSEDTELKGSLSFGTKLEFNGRFEGEIFANGPLVIGEKAIIKADINAAASVIIYGKVKGNIVAKDRIELGPKAHLYGDVRSPKFMISEGAVFSGKADTLDGASKSTDAFSNLFKRLGSPENQQPSSSGSASNASGGNSSSSSSNASGGSSSIANRASSPTLDPKK